MINRNFTPYESPEFFDFAFWRNETKKGALESYPCISAWSDICGFGCALERAHWNLQELKEGGLFLALSQTYSLLGRPLVSGVPPMPTERVLIINDGVARTTDLVGVASSQHAQLLFY